jgi:hypothetical protein
MVNAAAIADPETAAAVLTEPLLAALESELASLKDATPSKVGCPLRLGALLPLRVPTASRILLHSASQSQTRS